MRRPRGTTTGAAARRARHEHRARLDASPAGPEAAAPDARAACAAESEAGLNAPAAVRAGDLAARAGAGPPIGLAGAGVVDRVHAAAGRRGAPALVRPAGWAAAETAPGPASWASRSRGCRPWASRRYPGRVAQLARADGGCHRRRHAAERRGREHGPGRFERTVAARDRRAGGGRRGRAGQLVSAAETELVVVLIFFAAAVTGDQMDPRWNLTQLTRRRRSVNVSVDGRAVRRRAVELR